MDKQDENYIISPVDAEKRKLRELLDEQIIKNEALASTIKERRDKEARLLRVLKSNYLLTEGKDKLLEKFKIDNASERKAQDSSKVLMNFIKFQKLDWIIKKGRALRIQNAFTSIADSSNRNRKDYSSLLITLLILESAQLRKAKRNVFDKLTSEYQTHLYKKKNISQKFTFLRVVTKIITKSNLSDLNYTFRQVLRLRRSPTPSAFMPAQSILFALDRILKVRRVKWNTYVFCELKLRSSQRHGAEEENTAHKKLMLSQRKLEVYQNQEREFVSKMADINSIIMFKTKQLEEVNRANQELSLRLNESNSVVQQLEDRLAHAEDDGTNKYNALLDKMKESENLKIEMKSKLESLVETNHNIKEKNKELPDALRRSDLEKDSLVDKLEEALDQLQLLKQNYEFVASNCTKLESDLKMSKSISSEESSNLQSALNQLKKENLELKRSYRSFEQEGKGLKEELRSIQSEKEKLRIELETNNLQWKKKSSLKSNDLKNKIEDLKRQNSKLTKEIIKMNEIRAQQSREVSDLKMENEKLRLMSKRLDSLTEENRRLVEAVEEGEAELMKAHKKLTSYERNSDDSKIKSDTLAKELAGKDSEIENLSKSVAELNMEKVNWIRDMTLMYDQHKLVSNKLNTLQKVCSEQQSQLEKSKARMDYYAKVIKKLESSKNVSSLQESISQSRITESRDENEQEQDEEGLEDKLTKIRQKYRL